MTVLSRDLMVCPIRGVTALCCDCDCAVTVTVTGLCCAVIDWRLRSDGYCMFRPAVLVVVGGAGLIGAVTVAFPAL